jgi:hypothetical protein
MTYCELVLHMKFACENEGLLSTMPRTPSQ